MDTLEEVSAWVEAHNQEGDGANNLRMALNAGYVSGKSATMARTWLDDHENGEQRRLEAEQLELLRRSTVAAETAATAAVASAHHAGESARWGKWAAGISIFALAVSAWPMLRDAISRAPSETVTHGASVVPTGASAAESKH